MIYDHIKNIGLYKGLSPALDLALDYIATVTPEVEAGTYPLEKGVKAVVSEYTTSEINPLGYEAHRRYIDIQFCVAGTEMVRCNPLPKVPGIDLVIGGGYFLILFPEDAHEPGMAAGGICAPVKKVIMKVPAE